jgi:hypothetical protein
MPVTGLIQHALVRLSDTGCEFSISSTPVPVDYPVTWFASARTAVQYAGAGKGATQARWQERQGITSRRTTG